MTEIIDRALTSESRAAKANSTSNLDQLTNVARAVSSPSSFSPQLISAPRAHSKPEYACGSPLQLLADICAASEEKRTYLSALARESGDPLMRLLYSSHCFEVIPNIVANHSVLPCPFEGDSCMYGTPSSAIDRSPLSSIQPPVGIRRSARIARNRNRPAKALIKGALIPRPPHKSERTRSFMKRKREQASEEDKEQQHMEEPKMSGRFVKKGSR